MLLVSANGTFIPKMKFLSLASSPYSAVHQVLTYLPPKLLLHDPLPFWWFLVIVQTLITPCQKYHTTSSLVSQVLGRVLPFGLLQLILGKKPSSNITFPYIYSYVFIHMYFLCLLYTRCCTEGKELKRQISHTQSLPIERLISDTHHSMPCFSLTEVLKQQALE